AARPVERKAATLEQVKPRELAVEHALRAGDAGRCQELFFGGLTPLYSFAEWLAAFGHLARGVGMLGAAAEPAPGPPRAHFLLARAPMHRRLGALDRALTDLDEAITLLEGAGAGLALDDRVALAGALSNRAIVRRQLAVYDRALGDLN